MSLFYLSGRKSNENPWWERNSFWGWFSLGIAIVLTVIAAMRHDVRWLLILSFPCFLGALWALVRQIETSWKKVTIMLVGAIMISGGLHRLYVWVPETRKPYPENLNDLDLCGATDNLVEQIRTFVTGFEIRRDRLTNEWQKNSMDIERSGATEADKKVSNDGLFREYSNRIQDLEREQNETYEKRFKSEAILLRDQLLKRLPREERFTERTINADTSFSEDSVGWWRTPTVQDELARLSAKLRGKKPAQ